MTAISWLMLERYALGDLPADEAAQVEAALADSEALQAQLDAIRGDTRPLPALDLGAPDSGLPLPLPVVDEEAEVVALRPRRR